MIYREITMIFNIYEEKGISGSFCSSDAGGGGILSVHTCGVMWQQGKR